jgi:hypothetical protein
LIAVIRAETGRLSEDYSRDAAAVKTGPAEGFLFYNDGLLPELGQSNGRCVARRATAYDDSIPGVIHVVSLPVGGPLQSSVLLGRCCSTRNPARLVPRCFPKPATVQAAVQPPSMTISDPVTYLDSSEAR